MPHTHVECINKLKLFEYILYEKIKLYWNKNVRQHNYKAKYLLSITFLILKEIVK